MMLIKLIIKKQKRKTCNNRHVVLSPFCLGNPNKPELLQQHEQQNLGQGANYPAEASKAETSRYFFLLVPVSFESPEVSNDGGSFRICQNKEFFKNVYKVLLLGAT